MSIRPMSGLGIPASTQQLRVDPDGPYCLHHHNLLALPRILPDATFLLCPK